MTDERIRASDTEREQAVTALRAAVGEGRLTLDEGDERMAAAYAATYRDELGPLTVDLPSPAQPATVPTGGSWGRGAPVGPWGSGRPVGWWAWRMAYLPVWAIILCLFLIGSIFSGPHHHFFWPIIPIAFICLRLFAGWRWRWARRR